MTPRLALTSAGDLDLSTGQLRVETDLTKNIVGKIRKVFYLFQAAWFLAAADGIPWFQSILARKNPDLRLVQSILVDALKTVPEVSSVTNVSLIFSRPNRTLTVSWAIRTDLGFTVSGQTPVTMP